MTKTCPNFLILSTHTRLYYHDQNVDVLTYLHWYFGQSFTGSLASVVHSHDYGTTTKPSLASTMKKKSMNVRNKNYDSNIKLNFTFLFYRFGVSFKIYYLPHLIGRKKINEKEKTYNLTIILYFSILDNNGFLLKTLQ